MIKKKWDKYETNHPAVDGRRSRDRQWHANSIPPPEHMGYVTVRDGRILGVFRFYDTALLNGGGCFIGRAADAKKNGWIPSSPVIKDYLDNMETISIEVYKKQIQKAKNENRRYKV